MDTHRRREHLDAFSGRTVVFCHQCHYEWYQNEHDLSCPSCGCEITEIVDSDNDPRIDDDNDLAELLSGPTSRPGGPPHRHSNNMSGREEEEEEEHTHEYMNSGPALFVQRRVWSNSPGHQSSSPNDNRPMDPAADDVLRHFFEMISNIGGQQRDYLQQPSSPARGVMMTTFTTTDSGNARTRVTTISRPTLFGPSHSHSHTHTHTQSHSPADDGHADERSSPSPFPGFFATLLSDTGPPSVNRETQDHRNAFGDRPGWNAGGPLNFARSLQEILNMVNNPANARSGDAVYTQEALDRIISNLMEANPLSNAAPPATAAAIDRLEKRRVDDALIRAEGGSPECTICMDSVFKGQSVTVLPCKHWYHDNCVVIWLNEHNTCPICRAPIEAGSNGGNSQPQPASRAPSTSPAARAGGSPFSPDTGIAGLVSGRWLWNSEPSAPASPEPNTPAPHHTPHHTPDPTRRHQQYTRDENVERLERIRALGREPRSDQPPAGPPSGSGDPGRVRRHDSQSSEHRSRDRRQEGQGNDGGGGGGPFGWFRSQWSSQRHNR